MSNDYASSQNATAPLLYKCSTCLKTFKSAGGLKYHIEKGVCVNKNFILRKESEANKNSYGSVMKRKASDTDLYEESWRDGREQNSYNTSQPEFRDANNLEPKLVRPSFRSDESKSAQEEENFMTMSKSLLFPF